MRQTTIHLAAGAALALTVLPASAADLPGRMMPPPPMPSAMPAPMYIPMFTGTGFYVGANAGYGWGSADGDISVRGVGRGPISADADGFFAGGQAGYNWQFGAFLLGAEADIQKSWADGDFSGRAGGTRISGDVNTPWFGTLRGRVGWASDRWLTYLTTGGFYGKTELDGRVAGGGIGTFSSSEKSWSWTIGGGVETALLDRWSLRLEYLYVALPSDEPAPPRTTVDLDANRHIIRTGLNYRF